MIWCVEDDSGIRDIEVYALKSSGFEARGFENGEDFRAALGAKKPELIILDVMLPGEDGVSLLRYLKENPATCGIPVIMATAKGQEYDKIQSLDMGADDYLVKPFGVMELLSRVRAVLRRCRPDSRQRALTVGGLSVNSNERTVTVDGNRVALTYKEFELLLLFMTHTGTVFSRDQLMSRIWGVDFCGETRTIDMHIRTLRQKIGVYGELISTVRGVGYRMEARP